MSEIIDRILAQLEYEGRATDSKDGIPERITDIPAWFEFKKRILEAKLTRSKRPKTLGHYDVQWVKRFLRAGFTCMEISAAIGRSYYTIRDIKMGHTHKDLEYEVPMLSTSHNNNIKKLYYTLAQYPKGRSRLTNSETGKPISYDPMTKEQAEAWLLSQLGQDQPFEITECLVDEKMEEAMPWYEPMQRKE